MDTVDTTTGNNEQKDKDAADNESQMDQSMVSGDESSQMSQMGESVRYEQHISQYTLERTA